MSKYQGHKNWNHWNVSLWVNNTRSVAAARMLSELNEMGIYKTDDGAPFSVSSIRAAMAGII